jgi:hypothetical protein
MVFQGLIRISIDAIIAKILIAGAATSPRFAPGTALLQRGSRASLVAKAAGAD